MSRAIQKTAAAALIGVSSLFATADTAEATTILNSTVSAFGVDYIFFDFTGGALQINVDGITLTDPMIHLYEDDGSTAGNLTGNFITFNDDGGPGLNSQLSLNLAADSYVLAVGAYFMTTSEARSGVAGTPTASGTYTATFSETVTLAAVPLPAALPMLLVGLGALGVARRRKIAA